MITRRLIRPSLSRIKDAPENKESDAPDNAPPASDSREPREDYREAPAPRYNSYNRDGGQEGGYERPRYDRPAYGGDRPERRPYNNDRPNFNRPFRPGFKPGFKPGFNPGFKKKFAPSSDTNAENYYYKKQMEKKTPIVAVMKDGELINGWIEWYDRDVLKINRDDKPNLLVFKSHLKYIYKDDDKIAELEKLRIASGGAAPGEEGDEPMHDHDDNGGQGEDRGHDDDRD